MGCQKKSTSDLREKSITEVMVYDIVGDGDKHSYETFGLGRPRFHATSHLKI